ncbi:MAG TPA: hypothetical protein VFZ65_07375 [Planctomycetota bacterium]|nr:hypothetical protein [Planctomycetota bacterium]
MNPTCVAAATALLPFLATSLAAQSAGGVDLHHLRTPLHRAPADLNPSPGLWAAGADYKARFDGGLVFVPYLGEAASENAVFRWRTAGLGEHELPPGAAPEPRQLGGFRCEYDLGPLTEAYDVRADGLEQTFVLASEPSGALDVDLHGAIGGNLHGVARPPAHAPIDFADGFGRVVVRYGAALAIDALGARTPLLTSCTGDVVTIHLPRELLRRAAYPLVVDPLLSAVVLTAGTTATSLTGGYRGIAIERDDHAPNHNVVVAFTRVASLLDTDVMAFVCDDDFGDVISVFADLDANTASDDADVAFVGGANTWVLVLARSVSAYTGCRYHLHPGGSTTMGNTLTAFTTPGSSRETRPRVGGSRRQAGGTNAVLVRQRDPASIAGNTASSTVWASVLDLVLGTETVPVQVAGGTFLDAENPAVSKDSGGGSWAIAWQTWSRLFASEWQVKARRISQQGALSAGNLSTDRDTAGKHQISPRVDGSAGRYLLVFGEADSTTFPGKITGDVFEVSRAMRFDWNEGGASASNVQPSHGVLGSLYREMMLGGVSYDTDTRSHWAIGETNITSGVTHLNVVGHHGVLVYQHQLQAPEPNTSSNWHAVCFDDDHQRFLSAFAREGLGNGGTGYSHKVVGRAYEYPATGANVLGPGCSAASIGGPNRFQRGHEFTGVSMYNAPANMPALLVASWQTTNILMDVFGMTGCLLQIDPGIGAFVSLGAVTDGTGFATIPIPLPESVAAQDIWFQWLHLAPGANPAQIQMTGGMRVEIR